MTNQRIVEYVFESKHNEAYADLLRTIYSDHDHSEQFVANKAMNKSPQNPFFQIGEITSFIAYLESQPIAHISAMIDPRLMDDSGKPIGIMGFYECDDNEDLAKDLINKASQSLEQRDCRIVRGPVDITTWHNYRFALNQNPKKSFILEPLSQDFYANQFHQNGFAEVGRYASLRREDLETLIEYGERVRQPLSRAGFKLKRVSQEEYEKASRKIFDMSSRIFSKNWSFVPISFEEFSYLYGDDPEIANQSIIEILEDPKGNEIGFAFGVPDVPNDTLVIKSIGILSEYRYTFGGAMLGVSQVEQARILGLNSVTYALRRREKITRNPIYKGSEVVGEYIALERELDS